MFSKTLLLTISIFSLVGFGLITSAPVYAAHDCDVSGQHPYHGNGLDECLTDAEAAKQTAENVGGGVSVQRVLEVALHLLSFVAGVIAVIMIIIAGLRYITSQGSSEATAGARNTIIYAVIGIAVVVLSQVIVRFVVSRI